jgi:hypothetical protein
LPSSRQSSRCPRFQKGWTSLCLDSTEVIEGVRSEVHSVSIDYLSIIQISQKSRWYKAIRDKLQLEGPCKGKLLVFEYKQLALQIDRRMLPIAMVRSTGISMVSSTVFTYLLDSAQPGEKVFGGYMPGYNVQKELLCHW